MEHRRNIRSPEMSNERVCDIEIFMVCLEINGAYLFFGVSGIVRSEFLPQG